MKRYKTTVMSLAFMAALVVVATTSLAQVAPDVRVDVRLANVSAHEVADIASGTYFPGETLVYDDRGAWELVYEGVDADGLWLRLLESRPETQPGASGGYLSAGGGGYFSRGTRGSGGYFRQQRAVSTAQPMRASYLRIPHGEYRGYWQVSSEDGRRGVVISYERGAIDVTPL